MKQIIKAGGELDLLTQEELAAENEKVIAELRRLQNKPMVSNKQGKAITVATRAQIEIGSPRPGRQWDVRRVVVTGADPITALTGSVFLFKNAVGAPSLIDSSPLDNALTAIPRTFKYAGELVLHDGEILIVLFVGAPNDNGVWANVQYVEEPLDVSKSGR